MAPIRMSLLRVEVREALSPRKTHMFAFPCDGVSLNRVEYLDAHEHTPYLAEDRTEQKQTT
jgi:hypothetical protein